MDFAGTLSKGALKGLKAAAHLLGQKNTSKIARLSGTLAANFVPRELRIVEAQLEFVQRSHPVLRGLNAKDLLQKVFRHLGESLAELEFLDEILAGNPPQLFHVSHAASTLGDEIKESKSGALALSAHIGNFEILAAYHIKCGLPVTIIGREPNYSFLGSWLQNLRTTYGAESLLRGDDAASNRAASASLVRALRGSKVLAVLFDQDTALESEFVPFFGLDAAHPSAPLSLAVRYKAKLFTTFIVRTAPLTHTVISEVIEYDPESSNAVRDILTIYNQRLEKLIEQYPEQYLWFHRRWRRRPGVDYSSHPNELRRTEDYINWIRVQEPQ